MAPDCDPATLGTCVGPCGRRTHGGRGARTCTAGHPPSRGRGLCTGCRQAAYRAGTLDEFPRRQWSGVELLEEWEALRGAVSFAEFPGRVGVSAAAWEIAWRRARKSVV